MAVKPCSLLVNFVVSINMFQQEGTPLTFSEKKVNKLEEQLCMGAHKF